MKKLMTFCFVILFSVLSALSCFNFAFDALDRIEEDKISMVIEKPENINNTDFLAEIDHALETANADIMLRCVENVDDKPTINISRPTIPQTFWMSASALGAISWKMANVFPPQTPLDIPSIG